MATSSSLAALLEAGRLDEAESSLRPLLRNNPLDPDLLANLGLIAFRRREYAQARELLTQAVALAPLHGAAHSNLAAVLAELSEFQSAELQARAALALDPSDSEAMVTLAECLVVRENFDEAERSYLSAAQSSRWQVAGQVRFGRAFFDKAREAGEGKLLSPVRVLADTSTTTATHVLYLACSADYLERYGGSLIESLAANGGGDGLLHLHLIGVDDKLAGRLAGLPQRYARVAMKITAESPPLDGLDADARVAFYTGARFLRVPDLLRQYARPVVTLDIDAIVEGPTLELIRAADGADLALMQRMPQRIVWTNVLAGTVVFNATPPAEAYARLVKGYIEASMADGRLAWNLDQIALYCSLVMMRRFREAPAVNAVNAAAERVIYQLSPLRGEKQADRKYLEYFAEI